jgi:Divergent InlB B-repeat domain
MARTRSGWLWAAFFWASWVTACGGGHGERADCLDSAECEQGSVCVNGFCTDMDSATVAASADSAGTDRPVPVQVVDAAGATCELSSCAALPYGTQVTFRAGSAPGFRFTGWTGSPECTGTSADLVIASLTHSTHCTANYVRRIKVSGHTSGAEGGVAASSDTPFAVCNGGVCEVDAGQPVKLRASDRFGQRFTGWSGPGCGSATSFETTVSSSAMDLVCVAGFVERIVVSGQAMNAEAVIAVSSDGAVCEPGSCVLDKGGNATLSAPALPNFRFAGWSGSASCVGAEPVLRLSTVQSSQNCLATYTARVTVSGSASGSEPAPAVTALSSDLYASCSGASCQTDLGGAVTLLAGSASGYRLTGWTGPQCEAEKGAAVMLTALASDVACVATYLQGIAVIGAVVGAPGDVTASSTTEAAVCAEGGCVIDLGGNATLTAPSPAGYRFLGWDGDEGCASSEPTVSFPSVTQSKTCYARFAARFLVRGNPLPAEGGTVSASSTSPGATCDGAGCTLDGGGEVLLTAAAKDGYRFSGWSGGGACSGAEATLRVANIAGNTTCQANFVGRFTVAAVSAPPEGGSVLGASDSGAATCVGGSCQVDRGSRVSFTASAATGFRFTGWSGCNTSSEPTITLDGIRADTACTANFTPLRYTVSSSVAPSASGAIEARASGAAAQCADGACTVNYGSNVTLTAAPAVGWRFGGWTGCQTSDQATITVADVRADARCQATFQRITFVVSAGFTPDNGGAVTIDASGPGATCNGLRCTVPYGGGAALAANPANGWNFVSWSGCSDSTDRNLNLTNVTANADCRATFSRQRFDVTGTPRPNDGGAVAASSSAQGASCNGNRCTVNFGSGVTLRATASTGYRFSNWTGCSTSNNAELGLQNVTANTTCQANFERLRFTVAGNAAPANSGAVMATANGANADCAGSRCTVDYGGTVALMAVPATGFRFSGWTSCPVSDGAAISVANVTANQTCQANFERLTFPVVAAAGTGGAVAVADSTAATCAGTSCTVQYGGSVTFQAAAMNGAGFDFMGWTGGCIVNPDNPLLATAANVTAAVSCTASFALRSYRVRGVAGDGGSITNASATGGSCNGATCTVAHGGSASFTAAADAAAGYEFVNWTGGCTVSADNPLIASALQVTGNVTCNANFRLRTYTVAASAIGGTITSASTPSVSCSGATCTVARNGSAVFVAAPLDASYELVSWTGGCASDPQAPLRASITGVTADVTCVANFRQRTFTVAAEAVGEGTVTASASAGGAPCPNNACTVASGSAVSLVAAEGAGRFSGWACSDNTSSSSATLALTVRANITCTATFTSRASVTTRVNNAARGSATISGPATLACNASATSCTADVGSTVTLTATPASANFAFAGWTGCAVAAPASASTTVVATGSVTCAASFLPVNVTINGSTTGGGAMIFENPSGPNETVGGTCSAQAVQCVVPYGGGVSLSLAVPSGFNHTFVGCTPSNCISANVGNGTVYQCNLLGVLDDTNCSAALTPIIIQ